ncbi:uncharacterized protein MEPE_02092 [Melanopsichium pennsylvanicum]|uniref:Uncharacterized protein n=1 Tax=Melanopsichium pennsylvanicum TaxID=63383 RepID=A0AAJ5C474_9BASI|nr:uncharacterized protein MEPE_02092 [Melanopsichium pennsylvanicum]
MCLSDFVKRPSRRRGNGHLLLLLRFCTEAASVTRGILSLHKIEVSMCLPYLMGTTSQLDRVDGGCTDSAQRLCLQDGEPCGFTFFAERSFRQQLKLWNVVTTQQQCTVSFIAHHRVPVSWDTMSSAYSRFLK